MGLDADDQAVIHMILELNRERLQEELVERRKALDELEARLIGGGWEANSCSSTNLIRFPGQSPGVGSLSISSPASSDRRLRAMVWRWHCDSRAVVQRFLVACARFAREAAARTAVTSASALSLRRSSSGSGFAVRAPSPMSSLRSSRYLARAFGFDSVDSTSSRFNKTWNMPSSGTASVAISRERPNLGRACLNIR